MKEVERGKKQGIVVKEGEFQTWAAREAVMKKVDSKYGDKAEYEALHLQWLKWQSMGPDSTATPANRLKKEDDSLKDATSALQATGMGNQPPPVSFIQDSSSKMNITTTESIHHKINHHVSNSDLQPQNT